MRVFLIILAFLAGLAGGILSRVIPFYASGPIKPGPGTLEVRQVIVKDHEQLIKAISKVQDTVLQVTTQTSSGAILEGSGLILTSDGLFLTLADLVPRGSNFSFKNQDKAFNFQILKRDLQSNLALVKLESAGLPTADFNSQLKLGEEVFIVSQAGGQKRVNRGIVSAFDKDVIFTSIIDEPIMAGSAAFNLEGKIVGLAFLEKNQVKIIPASVLRQFSGL